MQSEIQREIEGAMEEFLRVTSEAALAQFLSAHRKQVSSRKVVDQKNKTVLVLALLESIALIFDEVEEEFGLARQLTDPDEVDNIQLIGDLEPSIREMYRRTKS